MAYEDYTTYDEVDAGGDITVAANKLTVDTMLITARSYVKENHGANHFGNFEHEVEVKFAAVSASGQFGFWAMSDTNYVSRDMSTNSEGIIVSILNVSGTYRMRVYDYSNINTDFYSGLALNTSYYTTIKRSGTTFTVKIYDDSGRTNLLDTLTITSANDTYSTVMAMSGYNNPTNGRTSTFTIDNLDLQEEETHDPTDDANASDAVTFNAGENLTDDANADDTTTFDATHLLSDNAKASDEVSFDGALSTQHTAKASDSVSYQMFHAHNIGDTAKASDAITFRAEINLDDIAKASDLYSDDSPPPPVVGYPCPTFTLIGTSTNILFPKPEWANPNNSISKNVSLFNFKSGDLDTVDRGINAQPLTIGGTVFIYAGVDNWCDNATMTIWLDSIKTAMNNGETFTINELGDCLDGVYVINNFTFSTIPGSPDGFTWSLNLERVKDI